MLLLHLKYLDIFFFNDRYFGYDDAIYSTLRALELVSKGFDYDQEFEKLPNIFSTDEINIETTESKKFLIIDHLKEKLKQLLSEQNNNIVKYSSQIQKFPIIKNIIDVDGIRVVFEDGWGLIRASNTTPKLVTRFEAKSEESALNYQSELLKLIEEDI